MTEHTRFGLKFYDSQEWEENGFGLTENAVFPEHIDKMNYQPRTLIDQTLETLDPTPNIHTLFVQFNKKYFWNKLLSVEVKWSSRMTSCAGVCSFRSGNGQCIIALSGPLLKLRPRKDLVETLLHEMIHAYLFLTNNNRDRDGHGPEFCKHMNRINKEAGTRITIYHNFHEEVRLYQQYWWKCNGPCQNRAPFFGTVRRAINRAPGPSDSWYTEHQRTCGGQFMKIREPEKKKAQAKKSIKSTNNSTLTTWINSQKDQKENTPSKFVKLGNAGNQVHGFGTGGPSSCSSTSAKVKAEGSSWGLPKLGISTNNIDGRSTVNSQTSSATKFKISGTVGGNAIGRSCLIDKYSIPTKKEIINDVSPKIKKPKLDTQDLDLQECPVCNNKFTENAINTHLDECLNNSSNNICKNKVVCPICFIDVKIENLHEHVDLCILGSRNSVKNSSNRQDNNLIEDSVRKNIYPETEKEYECCVCNSIISCEISLEEHLEQCVKMVYEDDISDEDETCILKEIEQPEQQKYPCPVCMELFHEEHMNAHLDTCITGS